MEKETGMEMLKRALHKKKKKNWIAKATENKGGLHQSLGVKQGTKLTSKELARGAKMGGKTVKQVALAKTLKGFKKGKKSKKRKMQLEEKNPQETVRLKRTNDHDEDDKKKMACKRAHNHTKSCRGKR